MYIYKRAYVKLNWEWEEVDISSLVTQDVIDKYQDVKIIATIGTETAERGIRFKDNKGPLSLSDRTDDITTWLANMSSDNIKEEFVKKNWADVEYVKFVSISDYPIMIKAGNIGYAEGVPIPAGMSKDIMFKTDNISTDRYSTANIAKNMMFTLNGKVLQTEYRNEKVYAIDGVKRTFSTKANNFHIIDFTDVGGLTKHNISEGMVKVVDRSPKDITNGITRCLVTLPTVIGNTTPILVLDGYLHILDGTYETYDANKILISINHRTALTRAATNTRFPHSYVDASNVRLGGVYISSFRAMDFLSQSDSFIALIHTDRLSIRKETLGRTDIIGGYTHNRATEGMVFGEAGDLMPYHHNFANENFVCLAVGDNRRKYYLWDTQEFTDIVSLVDNEERTRREEYQHAYIKELYTF